MPPVYSGKLAIRQSYAQTISVAGTVFCEILSRANSNQYHLDENIEARQKLLSWRSKLNKVSYIEQ